MLCVPDRIARERGTATRSALACLGTLAGEVGGVGSRVRAHTLAV